MNPTVKKYLYKVVQFIKNSLIIVSKLRPLQKESFAQSLVSLHAIPFRCDVRKIGYEKVALDIGCGNGSFTTAYAKLHPDSLVIGCEIAGEYLHKGARKAEREKLTNCKFIHGDGVYLLKTCIAPKTIQRIFFNFPDPWHKNRHRKRRMFTKDFLLLCLSKLTETGEFFFISDNPDIFAFALKNAHLAAEKFHWQVSQQNPPDWYPKSKYYEKWVEMGREIRFFYIKSQ